ncbi:MAG: thioredoxin [Bacteroidaceae bacterium]|nr:thioredoxin [Bacteroidaceae bacterium]
MELEITDQNFEEIVSANNLLMVDFWATWCGPCKRLAPVIEEISGEFAGKAAVGKCDIEENPDLAEKFGIMSIPTIIILKDGQEVWRNTGTAPKSVYTEQLSKY